MAGEDSIYRQLFRFHGRSEVFVRRPDIEVDFVTAVEVAGHLRAAVELLDETLTKAGVPMLPEAEE